MRLAVRKIKRHRENMDENDPVQPRQNLMSFLNQLGNCHQNDLTNQSSPFLPFPPANTVELAYSNKKSLMVFANVDTRRQDDSLAKISMTF